MVHVVDDDNNDDNDDDNDDDNTDDNDDDGPQFPSDGPPFPSDGRPTPRRRLQDAPPQEGINPPTFVFCMTPENAVTDTFAIRPGIHTSPIPTDTSVTSCCGRLDVYSLEKCFFAKYFFSFPPPNDPRTHYANFDGTTV